MGVLDCWHFTGAWRTRWGHGRIALGGAQSKGVPAHRVAYELFWGWIAPWEVVRHSCDVPTCCNPFHLEAGSPADNIADQYAHGYYSRREDG